MKLLYTLSIIVLGLSALLAFAEAFALLAPPLWLSQLNGLLIVGSMFTVLGIKVKLHTAPQPQPQPLRVRSDR